MKPVVIFTLAAVAALVFEWVCKVLSARYAAPASKAQWCCFFWISAVLLCGLCLMNPYDAKTLVQWAPMFLVALFHTQINQQREILERERSLMRYSLALPDKSTTTTP